MTEKTIPLDPRRMQFVVEYLKDFKAVDAAIRAGYSPKSARTTARRLLQNAVVVQALERRANRVLERQEFTADTVVQEAARIAFADIRRLFTADGVLRKPHELDDDTARAVSTYKVGKDGQVEVKLTSKDKGLELLAKYYGLLRERSEVTIVDATLLAQLPADQLAALKQKALEAQELIASLSGRT